MLPETAHSADNAKKTLNSPPARAGRRFSDGVIMQTKCRTGKDSFARLKLSCYTGFFTQAIIINLAPLYFVFFKDTYGINPSRLALLITVNFVTQIFVDLFSIKYSVKIGLRKCAAIAHAACFAGLVLLALFPTFTNIPYPGMIVAVILYSIGGGLLETVINPIFATLPQNGKSGVRLSLLHSFYCWGQMSVILITTLLLRICGQQSWWIITIGWSIIPLLNTISFATVRLDESSAQEAEAQEKSGSSEVSAKALFRNGTYIVCIVMIFCAGASELSMSQWASYFAEVGLKVDKTVGDLLGPCLFAFFMGLGRAAMGLFGKKLNIKKMLVLASAFCMVCYFSAALSPNAAVSLAFCALCGLSVSIMWPSALNMAAFRFAATPTVFGFLSLFGDGGCTVGPSMTGKLADVFQSGEFAAELSVRLGITPEQLGIRLGLLVSFVFPLILMISVFFFRERPAGDSGKEDCASGLSDNKGIPTDKITVPDGSSTAMANKGATTDCGCATGGCEEQDEKCRQDEKNITVPAERDTGDE